MNESELLFSEILKCDRSSLYLDKDICLSSADSRQASAALKRRIKGEPIQYILGKSEFMGLEFKVGPAALIPRPETELLVEKTIELSSVFRRSSSVDRNPSSAIKILDIGTGSGCVAVSLAKFLPEAKVDAIDISSGALEMAKRNAILNDVNINFIHGDLFNVFKRTTNDERRTTEYDLIISNPPYIPSEEIERLQPELQYEPRLALDGGPDGLDFYRRIIEEAPEHTSCGGILALEIGSGSAVAVKIILENSRKFEIIEVVRDYNGIERVVVARVLGSG